MVEESIIYMIYNAVNISVNMYQTYHEVGHMQLALY